MKTHQLQPHTSQKSYYGKALLKYIEGDVILQSYQTDVCKIDQNDNFIKLWNGYSATTQKHIASFTHTFFRHSLGKKEWQALELNQPYKKDSRMQQFQAVVMDDTQGLYIADKRSNKIYHSYFDKETANRLAQKLSELGYQTRISK